MKQLTDEELNLCFKNLMPEIKQSLIAIALQLSHDDDQEPTFPIYKGYHPKSKAQNFPKAALLVSTAAGRLSNSVLNYVGDGTFYEEINDHAIMLGANVLRFMINTPAFPSLNHKSNNNEKVS